MLGGRGSVSLLKSFAAQFFLLFFMTCDKDLSFLILNAKYWMPSCTICLIRKSETPMSLIMDLVDLLGSLSIIAWISPRNLKVFSWLELSEYFTRQNRGNKIRFKKGNYIYRVITTGPFRVLCIDWYLDTMRSWNWSFRHDCQKHSILFLNLWGS